MKHHIRTLVPQALMAVGLLFANTSFGAYSQTSTSVTYPSSSMVESSATPAPNDLATFSSAVKAACLTDLGGDLSFSSVMTKGETAFTVSYGANQVRKLRITTSLPMQNITANTFAPVSGANATTTSNDASSYDLAIGTVTDAANTPLLDVVTKVGFVILSRNDATYPLDVCATVFFNDGSTQAVTSAISKTAGGDDTFFGFSSPPDLYITNVNLASFATGTKTPINTRIGFDDFAFITLASAPIISSVSPVNYSIAEAGKGIQFQATSDQPIDPTNISLILNSTNNVSSQLTITGDPTNRLVSFFGLVSNQVYSAQIIVSNATGMTTRTVPFYTWERSTNLYDSFGFSDDTLYPSSPAAFYTTSADGWTWLLPQDAVAFVDEGAPYNRVFQQTQMGLNEFSYLQFPPIASGMVRFSFDVRVSNPSVRTIDLSLTSTTNSASSAQASYIGWGVTTNATGDIQSQLAYYNGSSWIGLMDWDSNWHHIEMTNYLSGQKFRKFAISVDGNMVGTNLVWRNSLATNTPLQCLRIATQSGALLGYGEIDNLIVSAAPDTTPVVNILNVSPANFAVVNPTSGIQFEVTSMKTSINPGDISLILNTTNDVSSQLVITGDATNRWVSFAGLFPDQAYDAQITVSNADIMVTNAFHFYTWQSPLVAFDSGGFSDTNLYASSFTNGGCIWNPQTNVAQLVDSLESQYGAVLRETQNGKTNDTVLQFPPLASGTIKVAFDIRLSNPSVRTVDFSVLTSVGGSQTAFFGFGLVTNPVSGAGQLAYYNPISNWVGLADLDLNWHHIEMVSYLTGPRYHTYDLSLDGTLVGSQLAWRNALSTNAPLRVLRIRLQGSNDAYVDIDNLVLTTGPETAAVVPVVPQPVTLIKPSLSAGHFLFQFQSQSGVSHVVQYSPTLAPAAWTDLTTIAGDDTMKTATNAFGSTGFYRVLIK